MSNQTEFQVMFDELLSHLKNNGKVVEISAHFGPRKSLEDMFNYIWELKDVHQCIKISTESSLELKSDIISENYRKEGNKYYQKKALVHALQSYNESILCASHKCESKNLSLGYANRSAVLFEMENYGKALKDISKAIYHGYPAASMPKLVERQAKCYIRLYNKSEAEKVLKDGLNLLITLKLEEESYLKAKDNFELILKECNINEDHILSNEINTGKYNYLFKESPKAPELRESSENIPSLNNAVELQYSPERGRFLVAKRDIVPGEVIIKEKGYGSITLPSLLKSHCSTCHERTSVPLPCTSCSNVVFCSEECYLQGFKQFHHHECSVLRHLVELDLGRNPMLAFRLIIQNPIEELKFKAQIYDKEENIDHLYLGFNVDNKYASDDYGTIYHLVTNKKKRGVSDLFKRCVIVVALVKLLLQTNYFGNKLETNNAVKKDLTDDIKFVGRIIFKHLMNLPCNAHSLTELHLNPLKYQVSYIEEIGAGAFGVLSLTNHSCDPSLARVCYGNTVIAKSIKYIFKGEEVNDSYGEHYAIQVKDERQKYLQQQYYFSCSCDACSKDWNLYSNLEDGILIKCPNCLTSMDLETLECSKCGKNTSELKAMDGTSLAELMTDIGNYQKKYDLSYKNVLSGSITDADLDVITKIILYLCKYAVLPNKLLFEAQETLKHCFDRQGSFFKAVPLK